ncbi:MAG TPA: hypothetical protein VE573_04000 [Nitrososphaeraceae archaeon]|nr:hypothetical protein [Nitrososphaeraceae archaeon]
MPAGILLYVEDCDAIYSVLRSTNGGAISIMEPKNQLYGDRGEGPVWRSMVDCDTQGTFVK